MKSIVNGETIRFVGGYYERKGSQITKYYMAGAARVAMRKYTIPQSMTVEYMLGDHLGSTSITTDSNGAMVSEMRYKPWGELRYTWTDAPANTSPAYELTRYQYTGQYSYDVEFGLKYYGARFYDSAVGRFVSADSIIPGGIHGYDRYAYAANNPVRNTDPSGHKCVGDPEECKNEKGKDVNGSGNSFSPPPTNPSESEMTEYIKKFGLKLTGNWSGALLANLWEALMRIGFRNLAVWLRGQKVTLNYAGAMDCSGTSTRCYEGETSKYGPTINFWSTGTSNPVINILHEFGHLVDNIWGDHFTTQLQQQEFELGGAHLSGWNGSEYTSLPSSGSNDVRTLGLISQNVGGGDAWQQRGGDYDGWQQGEDWADIFANAMIGNINQSSDLGGQMSNFFYDMQNYVMGGAQ